MPGIIQFQLDWADTHVETDWLLWQAGIDFRFLMMEWLHQNITKYSHSVQGIITCHNFSST